MLWEFLFVNELFSVVCIHVYKRISYVMVPKTCVLLDIDPLSSNISSSKYYS